MSLCRVCSCGCGRPLLKKDGSPDWSRRRFAGRDCLAKDKCNRVASKRAHLVRHPGPRLCVNGSVIDAARVNELVQWLRAQGYDAKVIRAKRAKGEKA